MMMRREWLGNLGCLEMVCGEQVSGWVEGGDDNGGGPGTKGSEVTKWTRKQTRNLKN